MPEDTKQGTGNVNAPPKDAGAPAGGAGPQGGEGREAERRRDPAEGREPPEEEAGLGGSRQRELERWGSQETETEPASERGLGTRH